ncbi:MAG: amidohydrolase family protein, partial [Planctomycetota bacterium]
HAIGDRANAFALDLFERLIRDGAAEGRILRIEHAQHLRPSDVPRFAAIGVTASVQPAHVPLDGPLVLKALGSRRTACTGSDWPVVDLDPLAAIHAAIARPGFPQLPSHEGRRDERLTIEEALRLYTVGSARALRLENEAGAIRPGMNADLTVLSTDILNEPDALLEACVEMTISAGRIVYSV